MRLTMEFKDARKVMLNFYYYTEKQFKEFIDIVPLINSPITYSPIMYNVLQSSCGQIENLMRLLCDKFELRYSEKNFPTYYKLLNNDGVLERQKIILLKESGETEPFKIDSNFETPRWWRGYNDTKHNLPEGLQEGNLGNVTGAISGLYALHCFVYYAQFSSSDILEKSKWYDIDPLFTNEGEPIKTTLDNLPKSDLFYSVFRFNAGGAGL